MNEQAEVPSASSKSEPTTLRCLGPLQLFHGEDRAAYNELLARISGAVKPRDVFEEIMVRDVVDLSWDVLRMRRLKACLLNSSLSQGVKAVLAYLGDAPLANGMKADLLAVNWARGDRASRQVVHDTLAYLGLSINSVIAHTLALKIDEIERFERIIITAEARRNATLHELDRHRSSLAPTLRVAIETAENAVLKELVSPEVLAPRREA